MPQSKHASDNNVKANRHGVRTGMAPNYSKGETAVAGQRVRNLLAGAVTSSRWQGGVTTQLDTYGYAALMAYDNFYCADATTVTLPGPVQIASDMTERPKLGEFFETSFHGAAQSSSDTFRVVIAGANMTDALPDAFAWSGVPYFAECAAAGATRVAPHLKLRFIWTNVTPGSETMDVYRVA